MEYEFEYLCDPDDLTGLNDLVSHDNLSDFNDLDCLFDLNKYKKNALDWCFERFFYLSNIFNHIGLYGLSSLHGLNRLESIFSSKN